MNYLSENQKFTDEEFMNLHNQYKKTNDVNIRNKLVMNYGYIAQISAMQLRGIASSYAQVEDMINQGIITLIDCIERFDPLKGIKFESYAYMRVRGGIIDLIRKQDWIPRRVRVNAKTINEISSQLSSELMRTPTQEEIANKMGISVSKLSKYNAEISNSVMFSFEELIQNVSQMGDILESDTKEDITPEKKMLKDELRELLRKAIDELTEKERLVISLYYYENLNFTDISKVLNVSVQRVSQINIKAISKLKNKLNDYLVN